MQKVKKAMENQKRFVLVHGICHGAWSWYKVKTLLEAAGHCVSAIDLSASGINTTRVEEIQTLKDYSKPLLDIMDSFPSDKKTILVAHSLGGVPAALAADIFPCKTAAIVFLTSAMPKEYQHWIISNFPPKEVIKIKDADHMPMNSKPQELCARLS